MLIVDVPLILSQDAPTEDGPRVHRLGRRWTLCPLDGIQRPHCHGVHTNTVHVT